jgi:PAS domain S-box-containing protein
VDDSLLSDPRVVDVFWHRSPTPKALVSRHGVIELVNDAWFRLLGYAYHELVGHHFKEFTHPGDLSADSAEIARLIRDRGEEGYSLEKRYITKSGAIVRVELHVSAIRSDSGEVEFFAVVIIPLPLCPACPACKVNPAGSGLLGNAINRCFTLIAERPREFLVFALLGLIAVGKIPASSLIDFVKSLLPLSP